MIPPKPRDLIELTTRDLAVLGVPPEGFTPEVVVGVSMHSAAHDLSRCLNSIAEQDMDDERVGVVILLDSHLAEPFSPAIPQMLRSRTWLLRANCGAPSRSRNAIIEFVEKRVASCSWIARLDWDDRFAVHASLSAAVEVGNTANALFVIGGNRVSDRDGRCLRVNDAGRWLLDEASVLDRLDRMANGTAENELPSCNLLLRTGSGFRYPDTSSAEDHWLVAALLMHNAQEGAVLESVLFADYTLDGHCTSSAKLSQRHRSRRQALSAAAKVWGEVSKMPGRILGFGQEGIVREHDGMVFKHFYPGILSLEKVQWLGKVLTDRQSVAPAARFAQDPKSGVWVATYAAEPTTAFEFPSEMAVAEFLTECLRGKLVCGNIKRSNFRVRADGRLLYIDIGNWLLPMDVSILRDSAARLYSIGVLGNSDEEVLRRQADHSRPVLWDRLPGFSEFFGGVVSQHIKSQWMRASQAQAVAPQRRRRDDVTLLIKACAMDAGFLDQQVRHLVEQFSEPCEFNERILAIDPHQGQFLRQHSLGNLETLLAIAESLRSCGVIDRVLIAPDDPEQVSAVNHRWFGIDCAETHSVEGVPVSPQLWAFEQVRTEYVLQCDLDALVGRHDHSHDFLGEMVAACETPGVCGVAFNIPHDPAGPARDYSAPPGEYKPEVRCGLLDLFRLRELLPLPNRLLGGRLVQPWYRALHDFQRQQDLRTLRGGSPSTFYIHPLNPLKKDGDALARVRDLVSQAITPRSHWGRWDVGPDVDHWTYPKRSEDIVVFARGRNTPKEKIDRFAAGLAMQEDTAFGVIVIDDASDDASPAYLQERLRFLGSRLTLVRHSRRRGRMLNNVIAIRDVCVNPESMIVVVDLDDALADIGAIGGVRSLRDQGHDVVLAAPFRPDVPTKVYQPDFRNPRSTFGGDVWIHLRSFAKRLFDRIPDTALQIGGAWLQECDDYATMIPIVEMATCPAYVPEFWYWHERTTGREPEELLRRDATIRWVLGNESASFSQGQSEEVPQRPDTRRRYLR